MDSAESSRIWAATSGEFVTNFHGPSDLYQISFYCRDDDSNPDCMFLDPSCGVIHQKIINKMNTSSVHRNRVIRYLPKRASARAKFNIHGANF